MSYTIPATAKSKALIILLIDKSGSMQDPLPLGEMTTSRLDVLMAGYARLVKELVTRSTKGQVISPRYRMACFAYDEAVVDVLRGITSVNEIPRRHLALQAGGGTDTAKAFEAAKALLERELPGMHDCPAPLVFHMTDGEYTGADPEPIAREIMAMRVPDGHVLVENIFISDTIVPTPIADPRNWPGILPDTTLTNEYAQKLRAMSSPLPDTYRQLMAQKGYQLTSGALMMLPGMSPELVSLGFQIAGGTGAGLPRR
jgi:uncharacterized protein YegL